MLCVVFFAFNTRFSENRRTQDLLDWSRQISQQTEALSLYAKDRGETDPIAFAVKFLMVGDESRPARIKIFFDKENTSALENFSFNPSIGTFFYSKVLNTQTGEGIQIQIQAGYIGFLGTHSTWTNDWGILITFLLIFVGLWGAIHWRHRRNNQDLARLEKLMGQEEVLLEGIRTARMDRAQSDPIEWKQPVLEWVQEAKKILFSLGTHIKSMTQEAKALAEVVAKSKAALELNLESSRAVREKTKYLELICRDPSDQGEQLQSVSHLLIDLTEKNSNQMDSVFSEYQSAFEVTQKLNSSITKTTQALIEEAKMIQDLQKKLSA
jgi:hypothetical protein